LFGAKKDNIEMNKEIIKVMSKQPQPKLSENDLHNFIMARNYLRHSSKSKQREVDLQAQMLIN
jgi:hypothetical protein